MREGVRAVKPFEGALAASAFLYCDRRKLGEGQRPFVEPHMFLSAYRFARIDHEILPPLVAPLLATLLILAVSGTGVRAKENTFVIADNEGYGIMDCITDGKSCGRVVADAWCEAHGYGPARSFGRASDITGATPVSSITPTKVSPDAAIVNCGD